MAAVADVYCTFVEWHPQWALVMLLIGGGVLLMVLLTTGRKRAWRRSQLQMGVGPGEVRCPHCGTVLPTFAAYCRRCGRPVPRMPAVAGAGMRRKRSTGLGWIIFLMIVAVVLWKYFMTHPDMPRHDRQDWHIEQEHSYPHDR